VFRSSTQRSGGGKVKKGARFFPDEFKEATYVWGGDGRGEKDLQQATGKTGWGRAKLVGGGKWVGHKSPKTLWRGHQDAVLGLNEGTENQERDR